MQTLPVDGRGYPVPWFVQWVDGEGQPVAAGAAGAVPEFRAMDPAKWVRAVRDGVCWVCGDRLGRYKTFVIGPMCGINRTTAEPPCHTECAEWATRNCPFLSRPTMVRRADEVSQRGAAEVAGEMIARNPGVTLLWTTCRSTVFNDGQGRPLIEIGPPLEVRWYASGRVATRAEVAESVRTGLPLLREVAVAHDGPEGVAELERRAAAFEGLYPKE
jgi:hypothetical protein